MKRAFASYTASIGVLTLDNTLLTRAVVASEFRTAEDLLERIAGGAGPGGVKAVAPVGIEPISVEIPAEVTEVSMLGEKLSGRARRRRARELLGAGRPIAIISNVTVEYTPAPAPPPGASESPLEDWKIRKIRRNAAKRLRNLPVLPICQSPNGAFSVSPHQYHRAGLQRGGNGAAGDRSPAGDSAAGRARNHRRQRRIDRRHRQVLDGIRRSTACCRSCTPPRTAGRAAPSASGSGMPRGTIVAIQDADLELDPVQLASLVQPILDGEAEVVYGSRFLTGRPPAHGSRLPPTAA